MLQSACPISARDPPAAEMLDSRFRGDDSNDARNLPSQMAEALQHYRRISCFIDFALV